MCENCEDLAAAREHLTRLALTNPRPCIVCQERNVVSVGTWIPDAKRRLAAGGNEKRIPVFSYWLCEAHTSISDENERLITQAILRHVR